MKIILFAILVLSASLDGKLAMNFVYFYDSKNSETGKRDIVDNLLSKGHRWIYAKEFNGVPTEENLQLEEFNVPDQLNDTEVLLQAVYLTVDPYMRRFEKKEGQVMVGEQLSEVIKTRNGQFPLGTLVLSRAGWTSHYVSNGQDIPLEPIRFEIGRTPKSYVLGTLGMPGAAAYFGLNKCSPKKGEIVVVSAAAGAVGHVVGQLAKAKGCTVIGFVGSEEKLDWCKNELGFDHVFNYKKIGISEALKQVAPDGVDIYFDNVGGDFYHTIVSEHMKLFGRVLVCGSIENYNDLEIKSYPATNLPILIKHLSITGLNVYVHYNEWPVAFAEMNKMIANGELKVRETVQVGIEKMRDAFYALFKGENIGKMVIKAVNVQTNYP